MKVALIQQNFHKDKQSTIKHTVQMIAEAKEQGAVLVVLQELHQSHYFCITEGKG